MQKHSKTIYKLTLIAMCIAVITISAWISIPFAIGFTLQIFAIFLISGCFPLEISLSAVILYLLLGVLGIPVFSGFNTGISALTGASGGFLVGFVFSVLIISTYKKHYGKKKYLYLLTMSVSLLLCYFFGCVWYMYLYKASLWAALGICVTPFLVPDIIKILLVFIAFNKMFPYIKRFPI